MHWHGYGPWVGTRSEYGNEALRRPGRDPNDEQTRTFLGSSLPPIQTGHALLRRNQTAAGRTWTAPGDALDWLRSCYARHPPIERGDGKQAYLDLDTQLEYAESGLGIGLDVVWAYYTGSQGFASLQVICCPHRHLPNIPCPLPPV
jgi:hypothetical protein